MAPIRPSLDKKYRGCIRDVCAEDVRYGSEKNKKKYDARHRADLQTRRRGDGERLQKCTTHATERSWKPIWRGNAENQPKSSTMHATGRTYEKPVDVAKR